MKIYISVDMEGATGVVHREQLVPGGDDYGRSRKLLMSDVNAAVEGALAGGADEVLVNDGHGTMRNLLIEELHEGAELISGPWNNKPLVQSQGIDESFDLGFFVGYHARADTAGGLLAHTWVGKLIHAVVVNGRVVGETGINAGVLGCYGVPVGLATGGSDLVAEAEEFLPGALKVAVKQTIGYAVARCRTPGATAAEIRGRAEEAVRRAAESRDAFPVFRFDEPADVRVRFHTWQMTERAAKWERVTRSDEREVRMEETSYLEAIKRAWQAVEFVMSEEPPLRLR
jgi:D-amino peptidase